VNAAKGGEQQEQEGEHGVKPPAKSAHATTVRFAGAGVNDCLCNCHDADARKAMGLREHRTNIGCQRALMREAAFAA
jgi:hypothetical protein